MAILYPLADFLPHHPNFPDSPPSYNYQGRCSQTAELLRLPRTPLVEAIACGLMLQLSENPLHGYEGKMYGVLLVQLANGEQRVLKAFSGLLHGDSVVEGWVSPIPGREEVAVAEAQILAQLTAIKQQLIELQHLPQRQEYTTLSHEFEQKLQGINQHHRDCKHQRQEQRQLLYATLNGEALRIALDQLDATSRLQKIERRQFKRQRDLMLQPLQELITITDERTRELKQQRQALSRQLQAQMHATYSLMNFLGKSASLLQLLPAGSIPTGTGDCCAPKLLHYAATHDLKPLAMAEFWWGPASANQEKIQGEFYPACVERCQPLMGFLLSGLNKNLETEILYADEWLIAVNKPAGLLSVPGRYSDRQDSVLSRLRCSLPDGKNLATVHRLDQETSGILLLARDRQTHRHLSQQFQQRLIHKVYDAILFGIVTLDQGKIELPLWGNPQNRPYQQVHWQHGKPSLTHFRVIARWENYTRVEFIPFTGRTHQLRVHAADPQGLGKTILGDRLYGCSAVTSRLHLHARELHFEHPQSRQTICLQVKTPF
ncbi:RluA family pseudouridine synthase [Fortiea contorta]|uniref:RluA family pseudouridine synthase n=1 Tax=Fortiea contorta TaxID=1892405 RepID=UPI000348D882|nr:pseudouridine synthase [Fortiea contorta]